MSAPAWGMGDGITQTNCRFFFWLMVVTRGRGACPSVFMHSPSSNNRGSNPRSRQPHLDTIPPRAHPQAILSPDFLQSPSGITPQTFPSAFPTSQYDYPSQPSNLLPPNWQRPRATSSYTLESPTLAFPEPHIHRATSTRAHSRPPSPSPQTTRYDLGVSPHITPDLSHRNSFISPDPHTTEVAFWRLHLETRRSYIFSSSK